MSKIIQICAIPGTETWSPYLVALCEDGSLYLKEFDSFTNWAKMRGIGDDYIKKEEPKTEKEIDNDKFKKDFFKDLMKKLE